MKGKNQAKSGSHSRKPFNGPPHSRSTKPARNTHKAKKPTAYDVYEYTPEKVRRAGIALDLDAEEAGGFRSNDEDHHDVSQPRLMGDEQIASDDDEEIDSDAAFEEDDEEEYAGAFMLKTQKRGSSKKSKASLPEVDLNENSAAEESHDEGSSEGEESGEDSDFIDVLDILDGRADPMDTDIEPSNGVIDVPTIVTGQESSDGEDEGEDSTEESEDENLISEEEDSVSPQALDQLQDFVMNLEDTGRKRKMPSEDASREQRPQKRRFLKEQTKLGEENEFRAHDTSIKLQFSDLLAPLASSSKHATLLEATKALSSSAKTRTLPVPLPLRNKERIDREVAYDQTKIEVNKWNPTMKAIQEAEHLSFPLQAEPKERISNLELASRFKPSTELERNVDGLLKAANLRDEDILRTEDKMLQASEVSAEDVIQRKAELRKMKELLFRAEVKAKRIAKIKSKTYRRLRRKEKEKIAAVLEESDDEESRKKREVERARERATLKHRSNSNWAKQLKGRTAWDEDARTGVEEMLDRQDKLRRKIAGAESDNSESEDDSNDGDEDAIVQTAFRQAEELTVNDAALPSTTKSDLLGLKFMKDALARREKHAQEMVDDFVDELGNRRLEVQDPQEEDAVDDDTIVSRKGGRITLWPAGLAKQNHMKSTASDIASQNQIPPIERQSPGEDVPTSNITADNSVQQTSSTSNPWLAAQVSVSGHLSKKNNEILLDKHSTSALKSKNKLQKERQRGSGEKLKSASDANVEITTQDTLLFKSALQSRADITEAQDSDDIDIEDDHIPETNSKTSKRTAFEQQELVAIAFAGDNVVEEFNIAKRKEIAEDAPKDIDVTIPGWGSWGGVGTKVSKNKKKFIKQIPGVNPKTRADWGKTNVIISEKRDKKAAKYQVKDLPYPYTSKAQYERRMEQPLGPEWNTRVSFQRGTLPRVVNKAGVVIDALQKQL